MRRAVFGLIVVAALAIAVPQALAKTITVDKDKVQCPHAGFTSIQAAVTAALPGDTIKVCPDLYNETVTVNKPALTIVGSSNVGNCTILTAPDPTQDSIVSSPTTAFTLANNNITLSGFVTQGAVSGVLTSDAFSGYHVTNTTVTGSTNMGLNLESSGTNQSRVDHSCFQSNNEALESEVGNLAKALIDHNVFYRNRTGIDLTGAGLRSYVTITGNSVVQNTQTGYSIDNSIGSAITHNDATGAPATVASSAAILIGGANNGLDVTYNNVVGGLGSGIRFNPAFFFPVFPAPNVGLNVSYNTVTGVPVNGIQVDAGTVNLSLFSNNDTSENGLDGIVLATNNSNNRILNNSADKNGQDGIHAALASGNTFTDNHMYLNVQFDARDDNRPSNTWTSNHCVTDSPPGTICSG